MKRINGLAAWVLGAMLLPLAGCQQDAQARRLVQPDKQSSALATTLCGSADHLIKIKRISAHRTIEMADKTPIDVWIIQGGPNGGTGTVLLLHGREDTKASYLSAGEKLAKLGYDVVLVDLRAHGCSGGTFTTYGVKEKDDLKTVMDALLKDKAVREPLYVFGVNLGAATAIQYAAIDPRVKGVMAVGPFDTASRMMHRLLLYSMPVLSAMLSETDVQAKIAAAGKLADFDPAQAAPVEAVKHLHVPLLLVHGLLDLTVPVDASQAVFQAANEPKKFLIVTPGPEQFALAVVWDQWIADNMDKIAKGKLAQATTQPAK